MSLFYVSITLNFLVALFFYYEIPQRLYRITDDKLFSIVLACVLNVSVILFMSISSKDVILIKYFISILIGALTGSTIYCCDNNFNTYNTIKISMNKVLAMLLLLTNIMYIIL